MKCFIQGFLGMLLLSFLIAIIAPMYCDYIAQAEISGWLSIIKPIQDEIEQQSTKNNNVNDVGINIKIPTALKNMGYAKISRDGVIFLKGGKSGQFLVLIPHLESNKFFWQCIGGSDDHMPTECKLQNNATK